MESDHGSIVIFALFQFLPFCLNSKSVKFVFIELKLKISNDSPNSSVLIIFYGKCVRFYYLMKIDTLQNQVKYIAFMYLIRDQRFM